MRTETTDAVSDIYVLVRPDTSNHGARYDRVDGAGKMYLKDGCFSDASHPPTTLVVSYGGFEEIGPLETRGYVIYQFKRDWPDGGARYNRLDGDRGTIYPKAGCFVGRHPGFIAVMEK